MLGGWAYGAIYRDSAERNAALAGWLDFYNRRRPHGALSHKPPLARLNELNNLLGSYTRISGRTPNQECPNRTDKMSSPPALGVQRMCCFIPVPRMLVTCLRHPGPVRSRCARVSSHGTTFSA